MEKLGDTEKTVNSSGTEPSGDVEEIKPRDFLLVVKTHLRKGDQKKAFNLLQQAMLQYPDDPFILSYYGCLQALVDRKHRTGVENCKKALSLIKKESSFGEGMPLWVFYLNLGKAYLAAGKKNDALAAFSLGLKSDKGNRDILKEMRGLGTRKKALVPFLDRSNPINKYMGLIMYKLKHAP